MQAGVGNEDVTGGPSVFDLPKLAPRQAGERARIWMPDPPTIAMLYVHGIGGKEAQQPGMPEPAWGGSFVCQGNGEVLKATPHSDPVNCFMCREHKNGNPMVGKAKRKFIVQVFRYATDPSANQPVTPFSMALLVWQFSDKQYRMLTEIQNQWGPIRDRDLLLTSDQQEFAFKQWAVQALPDLMLMRDPSFTSFMEQAWAAQAVEPSSLERILGKVPSNEAEVMAKVAEITPGMMGAPGMAPQQYATAPMMGAPGMAPAAAPGLPPTPGYAPPPAAAVYPPNGPFDQQQQYAQPPQAQPGMVPPPMPPTPPPAAAPGAPSLPQMPPPAAPPVPQAPPAPMAPQAPAPAQAQYAQPGYAQQPAPQAPPAPQMPQAAPPMAAPPMPQAPPAAPQMPQQPAPGVPQQPAAPMAPPVGQPGVVPQPGAPQQPGQTDYANLLASPPPPPPA